MLADNFLETSWLLKTKRQNPLGLSPILIHRIYNMTVNSCFEPPCCIF